MGQNECSMGVLYFSRACMMPRKIYIFQTRDELVVHTLMDVPSIFCATEKTSYGLGWTTTNSMTPEINALQIF